MKTNKVIAAAIAVLISGTPVDAMDIVKVAQQYGVDHREVMTELCEMYDAELLAEHDMEITE